jgi:DNA-binding CsgD family transcriptional regulator
MQPITEPPGDLSRLTPLQREILILVANGLTNREIATRLGITPGRVGLQIGRALHKLGLARRAEITAMAEWSC